MNIDMREQILQASLDELRMHGPNFHMDDLARRLRISKRTLYGTFLVQAGNDYRSVIFTDG